MMETATQLIPLACENTMSSSLLINSQECQFCQPKTVSSWASKW